MGCDGMGCYRMECDGMECVKMEFDRTECDRMECDRMGCDGIECDRMECDRIDCDGLECDRIGNLTSRQSMLRHGWVTWSLVIKKSTFEKKSQVTVTEHGHASYSHARHYPIQVGGQGEKARASHDPFTVFFTIIGAKCPLGLTPSHAIILDNAPDIIAIDSVQ